MKENPSQFEECENINTEVKNNRAKVFDENAQKNFPKVPNCL